MRLPTLEDVKEGIIASRIAAHAADVAKGLPGAKDWDFEMSEARRNLDWEKQFELAIDPEKARRYRAESKPEKEDTCTMCGKMCAVRNINKILRGEDANGREYAQLYGSYIHPLSVTGDNLYFTMSMWMPYNVFLMKAELALSLIHI